MILRNVTSCVLVDRLQRFERTCCIRLQVKQDYEDCGKIPSKHDMSSHLSNCTASIPEDHKTLLRENKKFVHAGQYGRYSDYTIKCTTKELWSDCWYEQEMFLFSRAGLGPTYPPIPGVKQPGRKADHSSPSSAEVKNE